MDICVTRVHKSKVMKHNEGADTDEKLSFDQEKEKSEQNYFDNDNYKKTVSIYIRTTALLLSLKVKCLEEQLLLQNIGV